MFIGGRKYSTSLRIMAGLLALLFYVAEVMVVEIISGIVSSPNLHPGIVVHLPGLIGFAFGTYFAMQRFRTL